MQFFCDAKDSFCVLQDEPTYGGSRFQKVCETMDDVDIVRLYKERRVEITDSSIRKI